MDKTGNGTIGANELAEVFDSLGQPMSYTQLFRVMEKYDKVPTPFLSWHLLPPC